MEMLPTFWSDKELELLTGTSLAPATLAKTNSLRREFDLLRSVTARIGWCEKTWWGGHEYALSFDDWKQVDAFYRSRALEFPGIGDAMVPCIDMANHASGKRTNALYESDEDGNAVLVVRNGKSIESGDEVTITYGDEKGACEMIFSYGFLEEDMDNARDIFLDLEIPDDDPLKVAKRAIAECAPGVRLMDTSTGLRWESDFIWLICVNEEDGLKLEVVQTVSGDRELHATWHGNELAGSKLRSLLKDDPLWDLYNLRAIAILQDRVEQQLRALYRSDAEVMEASKASSVRSGPMALACRLRELETSLLEKFYEFADAEVSPRRSSGPLLAERLTRLGTVEGSPC